MSDLNFTLGVEGKEKDSFLVVHVKDKLNPSRIVYADVLQRPTATEKDLYSFLLKEHLKNNGLPLLTDKLRSLSIQKIRVQAAKSLDLIKFLALAKKLSFNGKNLFFNPFAKPEVFYKAQESRAELEVSGFIRLDNKDISFSDIQLLFPSDPMWCVIDQAVVILPKAIDRNLLLKVYPGPVKFEGKKKEQFIEYYEDEEDIKILWNKEADQPIQESTLGIDVLPILVLTDMHGSFANLQMDYGKKGRFFFNDPISGFRNLEAEKSWEKDLLETGFQKKIVGSSYYYCPLDKVTKTLSFLLELGWKIIDAKGRQVIKHSSTNLNACVNKEEIVIKGIISYEDHKTDVQNVVGAFNRRERFVELSPYAVGLLDDLQMENELGDLTTAKIDSEGLKLKKHQAGLLDGLLDKKHISSDILTKSLVQRMKDSSFPSEIKASSDFKGVLYPYQQEGVNWLNFLYESGLSGLLADDMGLGKTVQVLAFLSRLQSTRPIIIVAPTSLIFNWKKEWENFLPLVDVYVHTGKDRIKDYNQLNEKKVVLTSYSHLRIDMEILSKLSAECVILDEAQLIKNPESQVAKAAYALQAKMKIAITGTPVENRWDDLWSIFHFLEKELLEDRKEFHSQMMAAQSDDRYLKRVKKKIKPFLLRRTKEEVALDLPEKILQTVWIDMSTPQRKIYEELIAKNKAGILKDLESGNIVKNRMQVLEALLRLRQTCCHPHLIDSNYEDSIDLSAKLERVLADVTEVVQEGGKVIIFSQFSQMLKILEDHIINIGYKYVYLDGSTRDRENVVRTFQEDSSVHIFLMSLKAGGVGLNLTAADYVFLIDPWWNDAAEKQAIDRAYRLGRKDVVVARRYVVAESVEEKIMKLKERKSAIASDLLEMDADLASFSVHDLLYLLE